MKQALAVISNNQYRKRYQIPNSLRFRASAGGYLSMTMALQATRTISLWIKRGFIETTGGAYKYIFYDGIGELFLDFGDIDGSHPYQFRALTNGGANTHVSPPKLRDPSAWYHFVVRQTATHIYIYLNGVQTYTASATGVAVSSRTMYFMGAPTANADGYLAEVILVDGDGSKTPSDFGETNSDGVWVPKEYAGTYGTNGFYLPFDDATSTTTLGYDVSGNNNDWTCNNFSLTAGVTYDHMVDTPTNNYAVLNPLQNGANTLSNANLQMVGTTTNESTYATLGVRSGKWYWEAVANPDPYMLGVVTAAGVDTSTYIGANANGWAWDQSARKWTNGSNSSYGTGLVANDIVSVALDLDNGAIYVAKNGVWQNSSNPTSGASKTGAMYSLTTGVDYFPGFTADGTFGDWAANFGQRPFAYTPPTGFKALCTANLPQSTAKVSRPRDYLDVLLYSGSASPIELRRQGSNSHQYKPMLAIIKARNATQDWHWFDILRGDAKLSSNTTGAESAVAGVSLVNGGLNLPANTTGVSSTGTNYVAYLFSGPEQSVANTDGTIASQVAVNRAAGFSAVTYTGTGANSTVGHGLGVAPKMVILKPRNGADNWPVWHSAFAVNEYVYLNLTNAKTSLATFQNSTLPTTTVFSLGTWANVNTNTQTMVAYCFAEIPGYSKFGSYVGNANANGAFVWCGFRPRFILTKCSTTTGNWQIFDADRIGYNIRNDQLFPNLTNVEATTALLDITSNGFKLRSTADPNTAQTYIFAAFAESPLGSEFMLPNNAR